MKTIAFNAHYKVVNLTLRHLSQKTKIKTCFPESLSNVTSRQNSQTAPKSKPILLSVSSLPETYLSPTLSKSSLSTCSVWKCEVIKSFNR